jgi:hypothetical protein
VKIRFFKVAGPRVTGSARDDIVEELEYDGDIER